MSRYDTCLVCIFEFFDQIEFCKVVALLNIFKVNKQCSIRSAYFNFCFKQQCVKNKEDMAEYTN